MRKMKLKVVRDQSRYWQKDTEKAYYHLVVKVFENTPGNYAYAFNETNKQELESLLWRLDNFYLPNVISYCLLDNHAHIIMARDNKAEQKMTLKEAARRYQVYYNLSEIPDARSSEVKKFRKRLNSISDFMRDFQRQFAAKYNLNLPEKRGGSLWGKTFKSVALKSVRALLECMKYVELNPVRAKIVQAPGDYKFSSWGHIVKNDYFGKKLRARIVESLRYMMGEQAEQLADNQIFLNYAGDLEALGILVAENKNIKEIDPFAKKFLLEKCKHWSQLKHIGGEDVLSGVGYGGRRPITVEFKDDLEE